MLIEAFLSRLWRVLQLGQSQTRSLSWSFVCLRPNSHVYYYSFELANHCPTNTTDLPLVAATV